MFKGLIKYFILILLIPVMLNAQKDWERWSKAEIDYGLTVQPDPQYSISSRSVGAFFLSSLKMSYDFLISDLDGDNCPFHPTCSAFFIQSVRETNFLKGSLMFADRFMRDTNVFKRSPYYPLYKSGRLYDPVRNYKLNIDDVKYFPRDVVVK